MDMLIKQSHEFIWHFTHTAENGICFCKFSNSYVKDYEILLGDGRGDFDAVIDDNNVIHLVCQNKDGDIIYLAYESGAWHKRIILKSKSPTDYDKNFSVININSWLNLFYTIEYHGKTMLSHQIIQNNFAPTVLDYIKGPYTATTDIQNNIWVFYRKDSGGFGYRKYVWSRKKWDPFVPFELAEGLNDFYPYIDNRLNFIGEKDGEIYFNNKVIGKGRRPILFSENNTLWCQWRESDRVQSLKSADRGETWRSSGDVITGINIKPTIFKLSYTSADSDLHARMCYGYTSGNLIRLYILNYFMQIQVLPPSRREFTAGSEVERFAQSFPEYSKSVSRQGNDIEYAKMGVKLSEITEQLSKLNERLSEVEKSLNNTKTEPSNDGPSKKHLWFF